MAQNMAGEPDVAALEGLIFTYLSISANSTSPDDVDVLRDTWKSILETFQRDSNQRCVQHVITRFPLFVALVKALYHPLIKAVDNETSLLIPVLHVLDIFVHFLQRHSLLMPKNESVVDGALGIRPGLISVIINTSRNLVVIELALSILGELQACPVAFSWPSVDTAKLALRELVECSRRHTSSLSLRRKFCLFMCNMAANSSEEVRTQIVRFASTQLIVFAAFGCIENSQDARTVDFAISALHNLCFDSIPVAIEFVYQRALDTVKKALYTFNNIDRSACISAFTLLCDLSQISSAKGLGLPLPAVRLAYETLKRNYLDEDFVIAGTMALSRITEAPEGRHELVRIEEIMLPGDLPLLARLFVQWKTHIVIVNQCLSISDNSTWYRSKPFSSHLSQFGELRAVLESMALQWGASDPRLYYAAKRISSAIDGT